MVLASFIQHKQWLRLPRAFTTMPCFQILPFLYHYWGTEIFVMQCIVRILTRRRGEEIEEGVILNSFCNSSNRSSRLMLLLLLNCLYSDILALFPINDATLKSNTYKIKRSRFPSKLDWPIIQTGIHSKTGMGNYCG